jgi:hypothetical protein
MEFRNFDAMERDDLKDDFLKKLVGQVAPESPSDGFTAKVMAGLLAEPETVKVKKPFYVYLMSASPWVLLGLFLVVFLLSSDIPYLSFIPGKAFFADHVTPYFTALFAGLAALFTGSKTLTIILALLASGGLLAAVDWLVRRRSATRHHTSEPV